MTLHTPADCTADSDAAECFEGARTRSDRPDMLTDLGTSLACFKLVLNRRTDTGNAGVQVSATERCLEHVQDVER